MSRAPPDGLPAHSVAVLLRSAANPGRLSDTVRYSVRPTGGLEFRFEVLRVRESDTGELMRSGLGFLPLAVLGKPAPGQTRRQWVPVVLEQVARRVVREAPADRADVLIAAAVI